MRRPCMERNSKVPAVVPSEAKTNRLRHLDARVFAAIPSDVSDAATAIYRVPETLSANYRRGFWGRSGLCLDYFPGVIYAFVNDPGGVCFGLKPPRTLSRYYITDGNEIRGTVLYRERYRRVRRVIFGTYERTNPSCIRVLNTNGF